MKKYILFLTALPLLFIACQDKNSADPYSWDEFRVETGRTVVNVTPSSAEVPGHIIGLSKGVTERGVYLGTVAGFDPLTEGVKTVSPVSVGSGFFAKVTGLNASTDYFAVAYAIKDGNIYLGAKKVKFNTIAEADVQLAGIVSGEISDVERTAVTISATVTSTGGGELYHRGVCYSKTIAEPTIDDSPFVVASSSGLGGYSVRMTGLTDQTWYYARPFVTNSKGTSYGNVLYFQARFVPKLPKVQFADESTVTGIDYTTGTVMIQITDDGGVTPTDYGVFYGTSPTAINNRFSAFPGSLPDPDNIIKVDITGLTANTTYYLQAYVSNSEGDGKSAATMKFHTSILHDGLRYEVLAPITAKVGGTTGVNVDLEFLDRNLGATRVATSQTDHNAYGWLFQWGRRADGHQVVNWTSATAGTLNLTRLTNGNAPTTRTTANNTPFYATGATNKDWVLEPNMASVTPALNYYWGASTEDTNYAAGGTNNPCPGGFRIPTAAELLALQTALNSPTAATMYTSILKMPSSGYITAAGAFAAVGTGIYMWAGDVGTASGVATNQTADYGAYALFTTGRAVRGIEKSCGMIIRCVKIY